MPISEARMQWEQAVSYRLLDQYGVSLAYLELPPSAIDKWFNRQLAARTAALLAIELFVDGHIEPQGRGE